MQIIGISLTALQFARLIVVPVMINKHPLWQKTIRANRFHSRTSSFFFRILLILTRCLFAQTCMTLAKESFRKMLNLNTAANWRFTTSPLMTKLRHWITYCRTIAFSNSFKTIIQCTFHLATVISAKISVKPISFSFRDTRTATTLTGHISWGIQTTHTLTTNNLQRSKPNLQRWWASNSA